MKGCFITSPSHVSSPRPPVSEAAGAVSCSPNTHTPLHLLQFVYVCVYHFVQILSLESNEWGESRHRGAWPRRVGVGVDVCVRRLPRGRVRAACAVLGDHGLVVGLRVRSGALLVGEWRGDPFKAFWLPLPGVVVGGVAHVVVDEGVLGLLVLVVAVRQLDTDRVYQRETQTHDRKISVADSCL